MYFAGLKDQTLLKLKITPGFQELIPKGVRVKSKSKTEVLREIINQAVRPVLEVQTSECHSIVVNYFIIIVHHLFILSLQIQKSEPIWISTVWWTSSIFTTNRERETEDHGKSDISERLENPRQSLRPGPEVEECEAAGSVLSVGDSSEATRGQGEEERHQQQDQHEWSTALG